MTSTRMPTVSSSARKDALVLLPQVPSARDPGVDLHLLFVLVIAALQRFVILPHTLLCPQLHSLPAKDRVCVG